VVQIGAGKAERARVVHPQQLAGAAIDADRDDQMCAESAGQSVRRSVSWPAAHRIPGARRWLICALSAARVRWSAARSLPA
jgi:hypothetical protein